MKIYKVEIEKLDFERGLFQGWLTTGYFANKEKAERMAKEDYENRDPVVRGKTRVVTIKVDTEE